MAAHEIDHIEFGGQIPMGLRRKPERLHLAVSLDDLEVLFGAGRCLAGRQVRNIEQQRVPLCFETLRVVDECGEAVAQIA